MFPFNKHNDQPGGETRKLPPAEIYHGLRAQALSCQAADIGMEERPTTPYGVLMETGHAAAVVTLVAMGEGSVSLYFSSGGGMIGGGKHDRVREAGLTLITDAADYVHVMEITKTYPLPAVGRVQFLVLTPEGVYRYEAAEQDLVHMNDQLAPLFHQAQEVITEFRRVSE